MDAWGCQRMFAVDKRYSVSWYLTSLSLCLLNRRTGSSRYSLWSLPASRPLNQTPDHSDIFYKAGVIGNLGLVGAKRKACIQLRSGGMINTTSCCRMRLSFKMIPIVRRWVVVPLVWWDLSTNFIHSADLLSKFQYIPTSFSEYFHRYAITIPLTVNTISQPSLSINFDFDPHVQGGLDQLINN